MYQKSKNLYTIKQIFANYYENENTYYSLQQFFLLKNKLSNITEIIPNPNDSRVITTGVPFLLIASDARAASMGDMGVATSVDTYSQFWNPSKYVFSETKSGFGLSYTLI